MSLPIPEVGANVPRRGGPVRAAIGRVVLRLLGWQVEGTLPDRAKMLVIAAPHSSNWDFLIGMAAMFAMRLDGHFLAKAELFRGPMGILMRWLGGTPVNRASPDGVVEEAIERFQAAPAFLLGIAPEGTRTPVERWKTGFYRIAAGAAVPVVAGYFDNARKRAGFGPVFYPTGDLDADIEAMRAFYAHFQRRR